MKRLKALRRKRVNRALESMFDYPLTVVEAPIGYGKTTAVREFLLNRGGAALWLSFLSSEDTASFFWDSFSAEIARLDADTGAKLKGLGFPADAPQTANVLSILNGLDLDENSVLVIDDFHLVKKPQLGAFLTLVAERVRRTCTSPSSRVIPQTLIFQNLQPKGCAIYSPRRRSVSPNRKYGTTAT